MKLCIVIPVYNHANAIGKLLNRIQPHQISCILVDDGSDELCAQSLRDLAATHASWVDLLRLPVNQGKGAAVITGMQEAYQRGYTHALQIDADGQHNPDDIPKFVSYSKQFPNAVICGQPIYDESVPKARLYGRYASHVWVWINTLSFEIADSMCGFRIYPLAPTVALCRKAKIGKRMDFDTEILVRLYWRGVSVFNLPTAVHYPIDGISHFRLWRDNIRITWMHTKLFFGMLLRLPLLLRRKLS